MVFEDLGLWPGLTVLENVGYPLKVQGRPRASARHRVAETLTALRIDSLAGRRPEQLTPPQRLRTALARALVTEPELLILDAPLRTLRPSGPGGMPGRSPAGPRRGGRHDAGPDG